MQRGGEAGGRAVPCGEGNPENISVSLQGFPSE